MTNSLPCFASSRLLRLALAIGLAVAPIYGWTRSESSSGGYSRPSSYRAPSSTSALRTPSTSGGYSQPRKTSTATQSVIQGSTTDRALARRSSQQALAQFRAEASPPLDSSTVSSVSTQPATSSDTTTIPRTIRSHRPSTSDVLTSISRLPMVTGLGQPRPFTQPTATSATSQASFPVIPLLLALLLLFGGAVLVIVIWRRFFGDVASLKPGQPGLAMRQSAHPDWFRLGMTLPVDPSIFILAAPYTAVQPPVAATSSGFLSVTGLGSAVATAVSWQRLYVADEQFLQVHLDAQGNPDECRYFSKLDDVIPADAAEWSVWLDDHEGLIGWPEFQTKDGQLYQRLWAQGSERVAPHQITETLETVNASVRLRRQQLMLYARPTAAAAPAPTHEYLLVAAIEEDASAWIAIHVGIDIPVAALQLS